MSKTASMTGPANDSHIQPFLYSDQPEPQSPWDEWAKKEECIAQAAPEPALDLQSLMDEVRKAAYADGHEKGMEEGRRAERAVQAADTAESSVRLEHALETFVADREKTVQEFEPAVVRLALAIAARILRREAHTDPLLLSGAVRVALAQLAASAEVRLRVPVAEESLWTEWAEMLPNVGSRLIVEAAEGMRLGDCIVETDLGSVDLGVRAQLGEIDRAFFEDGVEVRMA